MNKNTLSCPTCNRSNTISIQFQKNKFDIFKCHACGLMLVNPQPLEKDILDLYDSDYFKRGNKYTPKTNGINPNKLNDLKKIRLIRNYRTKGRLLDIGCGLGGFLETARNHGFDVFGVEISKQAADHVMQKMHIEVVNGDIFSLGLPDKSFDIITLWDVLEHVSDPFALIAEAHKLLVPDGLILISTGDVSSKWAILSGRYWQLLTPPQHLFFYTPKSLSTLFKLNNFSIKQFTYPGKWTTLEFLAFKAQEAFGPIVKLPNFLIHKTGLYKLRIFVNLYDIMICIAGKNS